MAYELRRAGLGSGAVSPREKPPRVISTDIVSTRVSPLSGRLLRGVRVEFLSGTLECFLCGARCVRDDTDTLPVRAGHVDDRSGHGDLAHPPTRQAEVLDGVCAATGPLTDHATSAERLQYVREVLTARESGGRGQDAQPAGEVDARSGVGPVVLTGPTAVLEPSDPDRSRAKEPSVDERGRVGVATEAATQVEDHPARPGGLSREVAQVGQNDLGRGEHRMDLDEADAGPQIADVPYSARRRVDRRPRLRPARCAIVVAQCQVAVGHEVVQSAVGRDDVGEATGQFRCTGANTLGIDSGTVGRT